MKRDFGRQGSIEEQQTNWSQKKEKGIQQNATSLDSFFFCEKLVPKVG